MNLKFLDYIEIGTSDFDTEIEKDDSKIGFSIEPLKFYLDKLPEKKDCKKINCAVSDFDGVISIHYIDEEDIKKYNLPDWTRGCNSVLKNHPTITSLLNNNHPEIFKNRTIPCFSLLSILNTYNVFCYYLKIDTEGHDTTILKHLFNNFENNTSLPHKILFESNILSDKNEVDNIIKLAESIGYELIVRKHDTLLELNINKLSNRFDFSPQIKNYYIPNYPFNYDPKNLPHENSLLGAQKYCIKNKCTGVTLQDGVYEVRSGGKILYTDIPNVISWIFI